MVSIMVCVALAAVAAHYSHMILHMSWNTGVFVAITLFALYFLYSVVRQISVIESNEKERQERQEQLELQRQWNQAPLLVKLIYTPATYQKMLQR